MNQPRPIYLPGILEALEIRQDQVPFLGPQPLDSLRGRLNVFKKLCEKQYRKLALEYHPDVNGGSKEAEDRMKRINQAIKDARDIVIIENQPQPVRVEVHVYSTYNYSYYNTATASTASSTTW